MHDKGSSPANCPLLELPMSSSCANVGEEIWYLCQISVGTPSSHRSGVRIWRGPRIHDPHLAPPKSGLRLSRVNRCRSVVVSERVFATVEPFAR
ncbi:hypothetical protein M404DRAFT_678795 [Pisolithus tinctorius Marx 270]|uniref:Uncharacterized protein n=1 Tax=Pisolithus tinctorius Marx 270 TaxID=870435 RepID=A0A0C3PUK3_PISTI|nr:hypothetical protein M404DRAFT_678795 [Pisolithus tinctorius Marx 270]